MGLIDCKSIAAQIKDELKPLVNKRKCLAIIHVGEDVGAKFYVRNKLKDAAELCVHTELYRYSEDSVTQEELINLIFELNDDPCIGGIVIQSPLPDNLDEEELVNLVYDEKDVDGFKSTSEYIPATPRGVLAILDHVVGDLDGKSVCLIGRGRTVGKPLIQLLLDRNVTLTVCHSHTKPHDLKEAITHADVVISAVGKPDTITKDLLRIDGNFAMNPPGCIYKNNEVYANPVIIDVGISRDEDGKQVGDVSKDVHDLVTYCTPWTNGCGLLTRTMLLANLLEE